jgi:hypothetical protein
MGSSNTLKDELIKNDIFKKFVNIRGMEKRFDSIVKLLKDQNKLKIKLVRENLIEVYPQNNKRLKSIMISEISHLITKKGRGKMYKGLGEPESLENCNKIMEDYYRYMFRNDNLKNLYYLNYQMDENTKSLLTKIKLQYKKDTKKIYDQITQFNFYSHASFISMFCKCLLIISNRNYPKNYVSYDNLGNSNTILIVRGGKKSKDQSRIFKIIYPVSEEYVKTKLSSRFKVFEYEKKYMVETCWIRMPVSRILQGISLPYKISNFLTCAILDNYIKHKMTSLENLTVRICNNLKFNLLMSFHDKRITEKFLDKTKYLYMNLLGDYSFFEKLLDDIPFFCMNVVQQYVMFNLPKRLLRVYDNLMKLMSLKHTTVSKKITIKHDFYSLFDDQIVGNTVNDLQYIIYSRTLMTKAPVKSENEKLLDFFSVLEKHEIYKKELGTKDIREHVFKKSNDVIQNINQMMECKFKYDDKLSFIIGKYTADFLIQTGKKGHLYNKFYSILSKPVEWGANSRGLRRDDLTPRGGKGYTVYNEKIINENIILPKDNHRLKVKNYNNNYKKSCDCVGKPYQFEMSYKIQWGGSREIYVMSLSTKMRQKLIEDYFMEICKCVPNEMISIKSNKRMTWLKNRINKKQTNSRLNLVLDCTKWAPFCNFNKYVPFVLGMQKALPHKFVKLFLNCASKMHDKEVFIDYKTFQMSQKNKRYPNNPFKIFKNVKRNRFYVETEDTIKKMNNKDKKIYYQKLDHFKKKGQFIIDENKKSFYEIITGSCYMKMDYGFMIGIFNCLSSLYHAMSQNYFGSVMKNIAIKNKTIFEIDLFAHSDDSSGFVDYNYFWDKEYTLLSYEYAMRRCNHLFSKKKCVASKIYFELISFLYINKQPVPLMSKFSSGIDINPTLLSFKSDISQCYSKCIDVKINGGTESQAYSTLKHSQAYVMNLYNLKIWREDILEHFFGIPDPHPSMIVLKGSNANISRLLYKYSKKSNNLISNELLKINEKDNEEKKYFIDLLKKLDYDHLEIEKNYNLKKIDDTIDIIIKTLKNDETQEKINKRKIFKDKYKPSKRIARIKKEDDELTMNMIKQVVFQSNENKRDKRIISTFVSLCIDLASSKYEKDQIYYDVIDEEIKSGKYYNEMEGKEILITEDDLDCLDEWIDEEPSAVDADDEDYDKLIEKKVKSSSNMKTCLLDKDLWGSIKTNEILYLTEKNYKKITHSCNEEEYVNLMVSMIKYLSTKHLDKNALTKNKENIYLKYLTRLEKQVKSKIVKAITKEDIFLHLMTMISDHDNIILEFICEEKTNREKVHKRIQEKTKIVLEKGKLTKNLNNIQVLNSLLKKKEEFENDNKLKLTEEDKKRGAIGLINKFDMNIYFMHTLLEDESLIPSLVNPTLKHNKRKKKQFLEKYIHIIEEYDELIKSFTIKHCKFKLKELNALQYISLMLDNKFFDSMSGNSKNRNIVETIILSNNRTIQTKLFEVSLKDLLKIIDRFRLYMNTGISQGFFPFHFIMSKYYTNIRKKLEDLNSDSLVVYNALECKGNFMWKKSNLQPKPVTVNMSKIIMPFYIDINPYNAISYIFDKSNFKKYVNDNNIYPYKTFLKNLSETIVRADTALDVLKPYTNFGNQITYLISRAEKHLTHITNIKDYYNLIDTNSYAKSRLIGLEYPVPGIYLGDETSKMNLSIANQNMTEIFKLIRQYDVYQNKKSINKIISTKIKFLRQDIGKTTKLNYTLNEINSQINDFIIRNNYSLTYRNLLKVIIKAHDEINKISKMEINLGNIIEYTAGYFCVFIIEQKKSSGNYWGHGELLMNLNNTLFHLIIKDSNVVFLNISGSKTNVNELYYLMEMQCSLMGVSLTKLKEASKSKTGTYSVGYSHKNYNDLLITLDNNDINLKNIDYKPNLKYDKIMNSTLYTNDLYNYYYYKGYNKKAFVDLCPKYLQQYGDEETMSTLGYKERHMDLAKCIKFTYNKRMIDIINKCQKLIKEKNSVPGSEDTLLKYILHTDRYDHLIMNYGYNYPDYWLLKNLYPNAFTVITEENFKKAVNTLNEDERNELNRDLLMLINNPMDRKMEKIMLKWGFQLTQTGITAFKIERQRRNLVMLNKSDKLAFLFCEMYKFLNKRMINDVYDIRYPGFHVSKKMIEINILLRNGDAFNYMYVSMLNQIYSSKRHAIDFQNIIEKLDSTFKSIPEFHKCASLYMKIGNRITFYSTYKMIAKNLGLFISGVNDHSDNKEILLKKKTKKLKVHNMKTMSKFHIFNNVDTIKFITYNSEKLKFKKTKKGKNKYIICKCKLGDRIPSPFFYNNNYVLPLNTEILSMSNYGGDVFSTQKDVDTYNKYINDLKSDKYDDNTMKRMKKSSIIRKHKNYEINSIPIITWCMNPDNYKCRNYDIVITMTKTPWIHHGNCVKVCIDDVIWSAHFISYWKFRIFKNHFKLNVINKKDIKLNIVNEMGNIIDPDTDDLKEKLEDLFKNYSISMTKKAMEKYIEEIHNKLKTESKKYNVDLAEDNIVFDCIKKTLEFKKSHDRVISDYFKVDKKNETRKYIKKAIEKKYTSSYMLTSNKNVPRRYQGIKDLEIIQELNSINPYLKNYVSSGKLPISLKQFQSALHLIKLFKNTSDNYSKLSIQKIKFIASILSMKHETKKETEIGSSLILYISKEMSKIKTFKEWNVFDEFTKEC